MIVDKKVESFDNWSAHWSSYSNSASNNPAQIMRHALILNEIYELGHPLGLLIDIGSGQGDFLRKAVGEKVAEHYVGFELSDEGVRISREKVPDAKFYEIDLFSPVREAEVYLDSADMVVCSDVIEHVDDSLAFCREIRKYLKPGGSLILTVPGGPMSKFDLHIGHRMHYTEAGVRSLLTEAGFVVNKVQMAGFPFFNLYRMLVIARGNKVISDAGSDPSGISRILMNASVAVFKFLFRFNSHSTKRGWQVVASAKKANP